MTEPPVVLTSTDGVAHIELNRPDTANALSLSMAESLVEVLSKVRDDPGVHAVLLSGRGSRFCAGGDLQAMRGPDPETDVRRLADTAHKFVLGLVELDRPVVVAAQGVAAGAGLALVLAGDLVVAGRSTRFLTAYGAVGLTPDCGTSWLLPRVVGLRRATELVLTPRRLSADEALDWGIATEVVDDGSEMERGAELARVLAKTTALGAAKALVHDGLDATLESHLAAEAASIARASATAAAQERIAAFLTKP